MVLRMLLFSFVSVIFRVIRLCNVVTVGLCLFIKYIYMYMHLNQSMSVYMYYCVRKPYTFVHIVLSIHIYVCILNTMSV